MGFSTKILVGLAVGVFVGLFFGEHAGALKVAADGFVKLLQMVVGAAGTGLGAYTVSL